MSYHRASENISRFISDKNFAYLLPFVLYTHTYKYNAGKGVDGVSKYLDPPAVFEDSRLNNAFRPRKDERLAADRGRAIPTNLPTHLPPNLRAERRKERLNSASRLKIQIV